MRRDILALLIILLSMSCNLMAQIVPGSDVVGRDDSGTDSKLNPITTTVPFLLIAPDTRAGGLGDAGVATTPDINSMHWNPAKYSFVDVPVGISISYTPWLRQLIGDMNLAYLAGYYQFNEANTISTSLLYFDMGSMTFTDVRGVTLKEHKPREFAVDLAYSRLLGKHFSGAVALRYIHSSLTGRVSNSGGQDSKPGNSYAADVAFYYHKDDLYVGDVKTKVMWGLNISNIGSKISYCDNDEYKDFIPTNFRTGVGWQLSFDEHNDLLFTVDFNKLLVPTPPIYYRKDTVIDGEKIPKGSIEKGKDPHKTSVAAALFTSWADAPGVVKSPFREELAEITISTGIEYVYNKLFALRVGYFHENKYKGNRNYFTIGAGLKMNIFGFDFAYLITSQHNPLANTLRFTLTFDIGGGDAEAKPAKVRKKKNAM